MPLGLQLASPACWGVEHRNGSRSCGPSLRVQGGGKKKNTERTDSLDNGRKFQPSEKDGFPCGLFALTKLPQMQRNRVSIEFYTRL